ncbi:MAG: MATE family efflux transporter [Ruminococcaceae bacterium]|nr:MATE family efflux transporter [Oscillospiraceae bacterium]
MKLVKESYFYKSFFSLLVVLALQNLITFGVNLADNLMIGAFSEASLSGVALVNQIQFFIQMVVLGIGEGFIVLASRCWGEKNPAAIKKLVSCALLPAALFGFFMWAIGFFASEPLLSLFTNDQAVLAEGVAYLKIVCFTYLIFGITNVLLAVLRSVETVRIAFLVSCSTLLLNICFNSLLIYGRGGFPSLGVRGAAIATLISRFIELIIVICYLAFCDKKIHLKAKNVLSFSGDLFRQYAKIAMPVIAGNALWGLAMGIQTAILGRLGSEAIAANSIATTLFQIVSVVIYASASASGVLIGKTIGEHRFEAVKQYVHTLQIIYLVFGVLTGAILFALRDIMLSFYTVSPESKELASLFITVLSVTVIGTAYQMPCLTGIVRACGDTSFVFRNDLIFMWGLVLPSAAISAFLLDASPLIVFCCLKADQILKCFVAVFKVKKTISHEDGFNKLITM